MPNLYDLPRDERAITVTAKVHRPVLYDVANHVVTARFDGKGGVEQFALLGTDIKRAEENFYQLAINGQELDCFGDKRVAMLGRCQVISYDHPAADITVLLFLDDRSPAVFQEFVIRAKETLSGRVSFNQIGCFLQPEPMGDGVWRLTETENRPVWCFVTPPVTLAMHNSMVMEEFHLPAGACAHLRRVITLSCPETAPFDPVAAYRRFDEHRAEAAVFLSEFQPPAGCDPALYCSAYNAALSNYKERGAFRAFVAGCNYLSPVRTYFRDSYWTVLCMYAHRPERVREQILTLAAGIQEDGTCPSAVKEDFTIYWGNHYDSPSFLAMMLLDYITITGDRTVLQEPWREGTILDAAEFVIARLAQYADETGLIVKAGPFNVLDWADNVNRTGYVTYDEVLYARANFALSRLTTGEKSMRYYATFCRVREAINRLLWDEEKGYYVDYKDGDFTEDHLAIDTVVAVLFGIADDTRARRLLGQMEALLETQNNPAFHGEEFGVACVFPPYKRLEDVHFKSTEPYFYHNGSDWPYWSAVYAYAKSLYGMDPIYPLTRWFRYGLENGHYTPLEFFSSVRRPGSALQAWSSTAAFACDHLGQPFFLSE